MKKELIINNYKLVFNFDEYSYTVPYMIPLKDLEEIYDNEEFKQLQSLIHLKHEFEVCGNSSAKEKYLKKLIEVNN